MENSPESQRNLRDPKVWGPTFWKMYDTIAKTYPKNPSKKQRRAAIEFFHSQKYLIPCTTCSKNYRKFYRKYPPAVKNREALKDWVALLQSDVAKHTAKDKK